MTQPMTSERDRQLRELAEMSGPDSAIAHAIAEIDRLRTESGDYAATCTKWEELFDQIAAEPNGLRAELAAVRSDAKSKIQGAAQLAHDARAELAARPTRAAVLRDVADL